MTRQIRCFLSNFVVHPSRYTFKMPFATATARGRHLLWCQGKAHVRNRNITSGQIYHFCLIYEKQSEKRYQETAQSKHRSTYIEHQSNDFHKDKDLYVPVVFDISRVCLTSHLYQYLNFSIVPSFFLLKLSSTKRFCLYTGTECCSPRSRHLDW